MPGKDKKVFFIINLVQDVNIVRGLVYLTARETDAQICFLITPAFIKRDRLKIWQAELAGIAAATGAMMFIYGDPTEALAAVEGGTGLIFAAAESSLPAHREVSDVFRIAPPGYLRVTLQHGFECVGFLQSREHVISHGRNISFAADVVCGWFEASALTSLSASERAKLYVSGPPTLLQRPSTRSCVAEVEASGVVCENLHSVRLSASGDHKTSFMDIFLAFCAKMADCGETVTLRPHPGGQYVIKNNVELASNVRLNTLPLYDVDLSRYRFGISAPSTIIFDMVLAGIPVGLWRDPDGIMDASNYAGLTEISTLDEWLAFERDVRLRSDMILDRQKAFLNRLSMPSDPAEVYRRFARLIVAGLEGCRTSARPQLNKRPRSVWLAGNVLAETSA